MVYCYFMQDKATTHTEKLCAFKR